MSVSAHLLAVFKKYFVFFSNVLILPLLLISGRKRFVSEGDGGLVKL